MLPPARPHAILTAQYKPDLSEGLPRLSEYPHIALSLGHHVGRVVLRRELDLAQGREVLQQRRRYDVGELLDRAAVQVMEGALDRSTHVLGRDMTLSLDHVTDV